MRGNKGPEILIEYSLSTMYQMLPLTCQMSVVTCHHHIPSFAGVQKCHGSTVARQEHCNIGGREQDPAAAPVLPQSLEVWHAPEQWYV